MIDAYVQTRVAERDRLSEIMAQTLERAATEERDATDAERESIEEWQARCEKLDAEIVSFNKTLTSLRSYEDIRQQSTNLPAVRSQRTPAPEVTRGWGDTFVESDAFRSWHGGRGSPVEMPWGLLEHRAPADPIMTTDLPDNAYTWSGPRLPTWRYSLLDSVAREPVNSNAVEWIRWEPPRPPAVAKTAEGALKPPLDLTPVEKSVMLDTYAVWKAITRQALEDWPRIRAIIEDYLRETLRRSIELAVSSAIQADNTIPSVGTTDMPLLAAIRLAMAQVDVNGYAANALIVNPADWAAMDIAATSGAGVLPGVQAGLWGLQVASDSAVPTGTAYVGDMRAAVTLFDRNRTAIYLTDSHADNFLRNVLVVLAETRAFAAVTAPTAMCKAIGDPTACLDCKDGEISGAGAIRSALTGQPVETAPQPTPEQSAPVTTSGK